MVAHYLETPTQVSSLRCSDSSDHWQPASWQQLSGVQWALSGNALRILDSMSPEGISSLLAICICTNISIDDAIVYLLTALHSISFLSHLPGRAAVGGLIMLSGVCFELVSPIQGRLFFPHQTGSPETTHLRKLVFSLKQFFFCI